MEVQPLNPDEEGMTQAGSPAGQDELAGRPGVAAASAGSAVGPLPGRYCTTLSSARARRSLKSSRHDSDSNLLGRARAVA